MKAAEFYSELIKKLISRKDIIIEKHKINYKNGRYDFLRIASNNIAKNSRILLIRAGIHGEEISGPISILKYINEIIDYANKKDVKLVIYPLGNPSGFENNSRYNIDGDKGSSGNNDFMRYELNNGEIVDDLVEGIEYKKWYWASDKNIKVNLPKETLLMHKLLKNEQLKNINGFLDLHQDYITKEVKSFVYYYSFGNFKDYNNIIHEVNRVLPVLKNKYIGSGFTGGSVKSDSNGFIIRHDCTLGDLMYRLGIKYSVTVETTGNTPLDIACEVNLIWIKGIIDLLNKN